MAGDLVVLVEHEAGVPRRTSLEAVSAAASVSAATGGEVVAVVLGAGASDCAGTLGTYGVDLLLFSNASVFDDYLVEPHVDALSSVVLRTSPAAVLLTENPDGRDIGARLAARLDTGLISSVVGLELNDGRVAAEESVLGGQYTTTVEPVGDAPPVFLLRPNAFPLEQRPGASRVEELTLAPDEMQTRALLGERTAEEGAPAPLEEASIIVSGGRGLGGPEPFAMLEELASELGGVVGASRAAVDAGWIPYSHQIGQTGRTVKPQLYFAVGISGAVQHRVGMQTADTVVAINRDGDAPIFKLADLGVVGDLFTIVPAVTAELRRRKGS